MKRGFVGLISLLIGAVIFVVIFTIITTKLLGRQKENVTIDLGNGEQINTSTNLNEVQKTVDGLQNQLQKNQDNNMETEIPR